MEEVLWWSVKAVDGSVTVREGVGGFRKGSKGFGKVRGIGEGCSRNRGSRFEGRGFCTGLYSRL